MIGSLVSHYQIEDEIGRGGMGVVYRARDLRLDRTVALKFLTSDTTHEPEARERFTREAKTAARTEHTNICGIYDIGETDDGKQFIAMPLYEGMNLADRIREEPFPPMEAVAVAAQVASGLASVHVHGIVHRDIKPGNILITNDGTAKILDFGLARTAGGRTVTEAGVTAGTFAYMSPEQIRGEKLDPRSDIWSLGVVLYELVSGKRPFAADYPEAVMYSVLNEHPPALSSVRTDVPQGLDAIVEHCLKKEATARYQSMSELQADLEALEHDLKPPSTSRPVTTRSKRSVSWPVVVATLVAGIAVVAGLALLRGERTDAAPPVRFVMMLPNGAQLAAPGPSLAISRDGTRLAFAAEDSAGTRLYIRNVDSFDATALPGTEGGTVPFFSPDGRWLGFMAHDRLLKVPLEGGLPQEVAATNGSGMFMRGSASWPEDDRIIFSVMGGLDGSLFSVSASGGAVEHLSQVDGRGTVHHSWPVLLPSGDQLLYAVVSETMASSIVVRSLTEGTTRTLIERGTRPAFVRPNVLVYAVESDLYAVPFDPDEAELLGEPVPVLHNVVSAENRYVEYDVSERGAIVYASQGPERFEVRLSNASLAGGLHQLPIALEGMSTVTPRSSPDGRFLAFQTRAPSRNSLWVHDLERGVSRQLTDDSTQEWWYAWTPDSRRIIFNSLTDITIEGGADMYELPIDGSVESRLIDDGVGHQMPQAVTPDGSALIYNEVVDGEQLDIFVRSLVGEEEIRTLVASNDDDFHPSISPDGRWLAFASSRSGRWEVYVQPFPGPGGVAQVSTEGGAEPVWAPDGRTLYYRNPEGEEIFAVDVASRVLETSEPSLQLGRPKFLLEGPFWTCSKWGRSYDLTADGKEFVVVTADWPGTERQRFNVVMNWSTEVRELLAAGG